MFIKAWRMTEEKFTAALFEPDGAAVDSAEGHTATGAVAALRLKCGLGAHVPLHLAGDRITARMFGQYLTLQRCEWEQMGTMVGDDGERSREIALRPKDEKPEREPDKFLPVGGGEYGGGVDVIREAMQAERVGAPLPEPTSAATVIGLLLMDLIGSGARIGQVMLSEVPEPVRDRVLAQLEALGWTRDDSPMNRDARTVRASGGIALTMWAPYDPNWRAPGIPAEPSF